MTKIPKLFEILQERGISPAKLSADTGISAGNISDWKSGRSKPSAERLAILSKYLNVTTDYLLGNETAGTKPTDEDIKFALFDGSEGVTDEMYDEVKRFARFIKEQKEKK